MEYCASISYGKDSLAMLHVIVDVLKWPLDRIITAEVWATDTIQADLPDMVSFKDEADKVINERWGIEIERFCATNPDGTKKTYDAVFHRRRTKSRSGANGAIYGWPFQRGPWCNSDLKMAALDNARKATQGCVQYIGIAADEPIRIKRHGGKKNIKMPLVEAGWTEAECRKWCAENNLLAPLYKTGDRGGCWFCHNQGIDSLRRLRKEYPDLWSLMLKWDGDCLNVPELAKRKITFSADGRTIHDYERRFMWEDAGYMPTDQHGRFRWADIENAQRNVFQLLGANDET